MNTLIEQRIRESIETKGHILESLECMSQIDAIAENLIATIMQGGRLITCGNGGSASDALHFAGEITGRFQRERDPWSAISLAADVATLTAISNDYGYDEVFARQVRGHMREGDMLVGISTSGNSENVYRAVITAKELGGKTAALLGCDGGKLARVADNALIVPSEVTARIQESHILAIHIICELVEQRCA